jgi:predicted DCC family thiol-disulfide oxidoreductase YuxK
MSIMPMTLSPLVVWYNTHCPVCRIGIDRQRNRLARAVNAGAIEFRNINLEPDALAHLGIDIEDVRRRLHGMDSQGRLYIGVDCAIEIWRRTPGEAWIARLLDGRMTHWLAQWTYDRFADRLYAWNRRKGHW